MFHTSGSNYNSDDLNYSAANEYQSH